MTKIAIGLGIAAGAGVLAEIGARLLFRKVLRPVLYLPGRSFLITPHEELQTYLPREIDFVVNVDGERGLEPRAGPGVHRILLLGSSAAECRLVPQARSLGGYLQFLLNQPEALAALKASVVHVGVIAKSQLDARAVLRIAECVLPHYHSLDTILLLCGLSDGMRWLEANAPSGRAPEPALDSELFIQYPGMPFTLFRPALLRLLERIWCTWRRPTDLQPKLGGYAVRERKSRQQIVSFEKIVSDPSGVIDLYKQNMRALIRLASSKARNVYVIRQDWLDKTSFTPEEDRLLWGGRIGHPKAPTPARFLEHNELLDLFRLIDKAAVEVAEECGVPSVSITGTERRFGAFYDDFHYTHEGAPQAAGFVAQAILEHVRKRNG